MTGKIVKGIAGFYYVEVAESGIYACKARGIFRKDGIKPCVGDDVEMEITDVKDMEGSVTRILPRRNILVRPPVANVDQALILFSMRTPDPNFLILDRILISTAQQGVPAVICFNKLDLANREEMDGIAREYKDCGAPVHFISVREEKGIQEVKDLLRGKTTVLAGPSGAGKSSFTNAVQDMVRMETGEISKKLARGKNTTRHAELIRVEEGTWLCDTPGFTSLDTTGITKEDLSAYYPEFRSFGDGCYFQVCSHTHEPQCAVREAVDGGLISRLRYSNYVQIYEELKAMERRRYR